MSGCYFCGGGEGVLESHHIVPNRFGGSYESHNRVDLCPTCHEKLERMYNKRFYDELGITKDEKVHPDRPRCEFCNGSADGQVIVNRMLESKFCCDDCSGDRELTLRFD
jgi:hypothetical protein